MKDCLTDGLNKLKATYDNPMIIVGGDTNNRPLVELLNEFTDMTMVDAPPYPGGVDTDLLYSIA